MGEQALADVPVAVRMSWAATRETTREEDIAQVSICYICTTNQKRRRSFCRLEVHAWAVWSVPNFNLLKYVWRCRLQRRGSQTINDSILAEELSTINEGIHTDQTLSGIQEWKTEKPSLQLNAMFRGHGRRIQRVWACFMRRLSQTKDHLHMTYH